MKLGFISDVHEDAGSLKRALRLFERHRCDRLICLGDLTGCPTRFAPYRKTRNAGEVIRLIRAACTLVVAGNHDLYAARKVPESRFGYDYPEAWYRLSLNERLQAGGDRVWLYEGEELPLELTSDEKAEICSWPEWTILEEYGIRIMLSHYLYPDMTGSSNILPPDENLIRSHRRWMEESNVRLSLFGHLHPEGSWWISRRSQELVDWGRKRLPEERVAIGVPAVCRGINRNGVLMLDTAEAEILSVKIPHV